jgi:hypothetical protein
MDQCLPMPIKDILRSCGEHMAMPRKSNITGFMEIRCSPFKGQYKAECQYGYVRDFLLPLEDLANWKAPLLSKRRENLANVNEVLTMLNSALFDTFQQQQGYANIVICQRQQDSQYGLIYCPSILQGIKVCLF